MDLLKSVQESEELTWLEKHKSKESVMRMSKALIETAQESFLRCYEHVKRMVEARMF